MIIQFSCTPSAIPTFKPIGDMKAETEVKKKTKPTKEMKKPNKSIQTFWAGSFM